MITINMESDYETENEYETEWELDNNSKECAVCLYNFNKNYVDDNISLSCNHIFHLRCILKNIMNGVQKEKCPLCRELIELSNSNNDLNNEIINELIKIMKNYKILNNVKYRFEIENRTLKLQIRSINKYNNTILMFYLLMFFIFVTIILYQPRYNNNNYHYHK